MGVPLDSVPPISTRFDNLVVSSENRHVIFRVGVCTVRYGTGRL